MTPAALSPPCTAALPISSGLKRAIALLRDTQSRQTAVTELSKLVDVILVVGAKNSSNSNRLREIGEEDGTPSYLIADGLRPPRGRTGLTAPKRWVITAGASAPEVLVEDVIDALGRLGPGRSE